jgi:Flp pilus assembly protein TadG
MMRKLDQRGVAALEFCLVALPLFLLMFAIFDLGVYAITMQSLRTLANAGARAVMIKCYTVDAIARTSPSGCTAIDTYFPVDPQRQDAAPFLYGARLTLTPKLTITSAASTLTVKAELVNKTDPAKPGFTMLMPIWGTTATALGLNIPGFNKPASASTSIPF